MKIRYAICLALNEKDYKDMGECRKRGIKQIDIFRKGLEEGLKEGIKQK